MPIGIGLQTAISIGGSRKTIVYECDVVSYENIVFDVHAFADKGMARNLAVLAYASAFLYFHKSSHFATIIYAASVGVHPVENAHIFSELHIVEALPFVVYGYQFHTRLLVDEDFYAFVLD
jgi:hypothetical protein